MNSLGILKEEFLSIFYLSCIQTVLNFTFPVFLRLGYPLNFFIAGLVSLLCICIIIYVFKSLDKIAPRFNLEYLDEYPHAGTFKNIEKIGLIIVFHCSYLCAWYNNIYSSPDIYYLIYYIHFTVSFFLIRRAINKHMRKDKVVER